jgi:hypothetical protein
VILGYSLPMHWDRQEQLSHIAGRLRDDHGPLFWLQLIREEAEIYGTAEAQPGDVDPIEQDELREDHHQAPEPAEEPPYCDACGHYGHERDSLACAFT